MPLDTRAPHDRLDLMAGPRPSTGTLPDPYPYETIAPVCEGFVKRDGVRTWYAQFGTTGPWLAFPPVYQIANTHLLKGFSMRSRDDWPNNSQLCLARP